MPDHQPLLIPIDKQLGEFKQHLDGNKRSIFSARFGDGKTVFLKEFIETYKDEYLFVPIYPVNYQVADNKDIFEYIKRDILIRLLASEDVVVVDEAVPENLLIKSFLKEEKWNLLSDIVQALPTINIGPLNIDAGRMLDSAKNINDRRKKYAEDNKSDEKKIEEYIQSIAKQKGSIYEFDFYSELIRNLNDATRRNTEKKGKEKKIVLLIEDLDRIDPEHIFRILNIFSAHFDGMESSSDSESKFIGFDKIVTVCHYENIKNIYAHKYGADTDFNGYIHKFSTARPFYYSLKEGLEKYILESIDEEIRKYEMVAESTMQAIMNKYTPRSIQSNIRHIVDNLNDFSRIENGEVKLNDRHYLKRNSLTKLLCICSNFQIEITSIVNQRNMQSNSFQKLAQETWGLRNVFSGDYESFYDEYQTRIQEFSQYIINNNE